MLRIGMPQDMAPACSCTVPLGHEAALSASKDAAACQLALRHDGLYSNSVEMMAGPTWLAHPWKLHALPHLLLEETISYVIMVHGRVQHTNSL